MSTAATLRKVEQLKDRGEDFEWFPTDQKMIDTIAKDIDDTHYSDRYSSREGDLLDIGAGDGRVLLGIKKWFYRRNADVHHRWRTEDKEPITEEQLERLREESTDSGWFRADLFAIEKSSVHLQAMPKTITVIGTDFMEQTLVDKPMGYIFCNPPYSEYEEWMIKILRECQAAYVYMIVPRRWRDSVKIQHAIKAREIDVHSLGEFDFEKADRQARAKVEIVRFFYNYQNRESFDTMLEEMMPELDVFTKDAGLEDIPEDDVEECDVTEGSESLIEQLVKAYNKEVEETVENYRGAMKIPVKILAELGVSKKCILTGIREKITGLKNRYWKSLFSNLSSVTSRLATKQRDAFLSSLSNKSHIDFTEGNILSMLIWVTKWANDHFDDQLIDLFKTLADDCNVTKYKSNDRVWNKGWRYSHYNEDRGNTHFKLEYRIVICHGGICTGSSSWRADQYRGLEERAYNLISDIVTVANNLGFVCEDSPKNYKWEPNKQNKIMLAPRMAGRPLAAIRAFKNGNLHIHFDSKFILAVNVEAGRLLGWLHSPKEAVDELQAEGEDAEFVKEKFGGSFRIEANNIPRLTAKPTKPAPVADITPPPKKTRSEFVPSVIPPPPKRAAIVAAPTIPPPPKHRPSQLVFARTQTEHDDCHSLVPTAVR
jgi:hypothetical protein